MGLELNEKCENSGFNESIFNQLDAEIMSVLINKNIKYELQVRREQVGGMFNLKREKCKVLSNSPV